MKDRIKLIIEKENLTPAKFADMLNINRAVISHILNGRNNPSLDVVTKILGEMKHINPEWLINDSGNMYKNEVNYNYVPEEPSLFNQNEIISEDNKKDLEKHVESGLKYHENNYQSSVIKPVEYVSKADRKITQIIIYYNDNTFEKFSQ